MARSLNNNITHGREMGTLQCLLDLWLKQLCNNNNNKCTGNLSSYFVTKSYLLCSSIIVTGMKKSFFINLLFFVKMAHSCVIFWPVSCAFYCRVQPTWADYKEIKFIAPWVALGICVLFSFFFGRKLPHL